MKKAIAILLLPACLLPGGCSAFQTDVSEQMSRFELSVSSEESSAEEQFYDEAGVYGNGVRLLARTVETYSQGVSDRYEEYAVEVNGELLYPFGSGVKEIREENGFLRVLGDSGDALLDEDGNELFAFGEYERFYFSTNWLTAIRSDGGCALFRMKEGGIEQAYESETAYYFAAEWGGTAQFSGTDANLLIASDGTVTVTALTNQEELVQNGALLEDTAKSFYQALRGSDAGAYDVLLPFLPLEAAERLADAEPPETADPYALKGYELLRWLLQYSGGLSETCEPTAWEIACTAPGGSSVGILLFDCGQYAFEIPFAITAKADGTFYVSAFGGSLV